MGKEFSTGNPGEQLLHALQGLAKDAEVPSPEVRLFGPAPCRP
jgi:hypothetical protein